MHEVDPDRAQRDSPTTADTRAVLTTLHVRMRSVLRTAAAAGKVPARRSWLTGHRNDADGRCPRCGNRLAHGRVGGRSTVWCPHCQPAP